MHGSGSQWLCRRRCLAQRHSWLGHSSMSSQKCLTALRCHFFHSMLWVIPAFLTHYMLILTSTAYSENLIYKLTSLPALMQEANRNPSAFRQDSTLVTSTNFSHSKPGPQTEAKLLGLHLHRQDTQMAAERQLGRELPAADGKAFLQNCLSSSIDQESLKTAGLWQVGKVQMNSISFFPTDSREPA